eukprot:COSAG06_NODE_9115_length_1982_cov_2.950024_2_plen_41_part_01
MLLPLCRCVHRRRLGDPLHVPQHATIRWAHAYHPVKKPRGR